MSGVTTVILDEFKESKYILLHSVKYNSIREKNQFFYIWKFTSVFLPHKIVDEKNMRSDRLLIFASYLTFDIICAHPPERRAFPITWSRGGLCGTGEGRACQGCTNPVLGFEII